MIWKLQYKKKSFVQRTMEHRLKKSFFQSVRYIVVTKIKCDLRNNLQLVFSLGSTTITSLIYQRVSLRKLRSIEEYLVLESGSLQFPANFCLTNWFLRLILTPKTSLKATHHGFGYSFLQCHVCNGCQVREGNQDKKWILLIYIQFFVQAFLLYFSYYFKTTTVPFGSVPNSRPYHFRTVYGNSSPIRSNVDLNYAQNILLTSTCNQTPPPLIGSFVVACMCPPPKLANLKSSLPTGSRWFIKEEKNQKIPNPTHVSRKATVHFSTDPVANWSFQHSPLSTPYRTVTASLSSLVVHWKRYTHCTTTHRDTETYQLACTSSSLPKLPSFVAM